VIVLDSVSAARDELCPSRLVRLPRLKRFIAIMSPGEGSPCLPTQKDVIFGRDTASWINGGNRLLRRMIEKHHEDYTPTMTAAEIRKLIAVIIGDLKSSGARFLKLDHSTQQYYEVDDKTCFDKVCSRSRNVLSRHVCTSSSNTLFRLVVPFVISTLHTSEEVRRGRRQKMLIGDNWLALAASIA
jgi:hypothetical protein